MSLEAALAENTAAMTALAAVLAQNNANLERVIAGQEAAMAKLEGATSTATRSRKKADPAPAAAADAGNAAENAAMESQEAAATTAVEPVTQEIVRAAAAAMIESAKGADGEVIPAKKKAVDDLMVSLTKHFGTPKLLGPQSTLDGDQLKQTLFYFKRMTAGIPVDLSAEYDFDGDPTQGGAAAQAEEEDPLG